MNEIEAYLAPYTPEIRFAADALRALIKDAVPGAQERLRRGWQLIGYRSPASLGGRYFCFIAPYADHLRLGFEWGVLLADEDRELEGQGTQVRYRTVRTLADIDREPLTRFIQEAASVAALSKEQKAALALQRAAERERPS